MEDKQKLVANEVFAEFAEYSLDSLPVTLVSSSTVSPISIISIASEENNYGSTNQIKKECKTLDSDGSLIENEKSPAGFRKMHLAALAALMNAVGMGMASSYSAPATINMQQSSSRVQLTGNDQVTWIASLIAIGGLVGGAAAGYLSYRFGRKATLMCNSIPYLTGWLMVAYAPSLAWIYAGRLLTGFSCGLLAVTATTYVVEISTPDVRGLLGAWFQLAFVIGVLITMTFGAFLTWDWLAAIGALVVVVAVILLYFMPESPRWLAAGGYSSEAIQAIQFLQGSQFDAVAEYNKIATDIANHHTGRITLLHFKDAKLYKPLLLSLGLMFFQQFSGINAIMSYTVSIFEDAGSSLNASLATIVIATVQVFATLLSSVLMDRAGRRLLFLVSGSFVTLSLLLFGIYSVIKATTPNSTTTFGWIPVTCFIVYVASFSIGYGPIPWLMVPEMVPIHARSLIGGIATAFNWICLFVITKTFEDLDEIFHDYGIYWFYGFFAFLGCLFCWFFLPETKGKPLEEIQEYFKDNLKGKSRWWLSVKFRRNGHPS